VAIAHAAHAKVAEIQDLNPHVLRGLTPPRDSFTVRVPVGAADSFAVAFDSLPRSEKEGLSTVVSKKGESFATIAKRERLSTRQLEIYNPKLKVLKSGNLAPGQTVVVPSEAVVEAAAPVPDPSIERYSSTPAATMHVVKRGETIGSLAKKYHTTTAALMKANHLRRPIVLPGQSLVVGGTAMKAALARSSKASAEKTVAEAGSEKASSKAAKTKQAASETAAKTERKHASASDKTLVSEKSGKATTAKKSAHASKASSQKSVARSDVAKKASAKSATSKTASSKAGSAKGTAKTSTKAASAKSSSDKKQIARTSSEKKKALAKN
jgi:LysM repeat protein